MFIVQGYRILLHCTVQLLYQHHHKKKLMALFKNRAQRTLIVIIQVVVCFFVFGCNNSNAAKRKQAVAVPAAKPDHRCKTSCCYARHPTATNIRHYIIQYTGKTPDA